MNEGTRLPSWIVIGVSMLGVVLIVATLFLATARNRVDKQRTAVAAYIVDHVVAACPADRPVHIEPALDARFGTQFLSILETSAPLLADWRVARYALSDEEQQEVHAIWAAIGRGESGPADLRSEDSWIVSATRSLRGQLVQATRSKDGCFAATIPGIAVEPGPSWQDAADLLRIHLLEAATSITGGAWGRGGGHCLAVAATTRDLFWTGDGLAWAAAGTILPELAEICGRLFEQPGETATARRLYEELSHIHQGIPDADRLMSMEISEMATLLAPLLLTPEEAARLPGGGPADRGPTDAILGSLGRADQTPVAVVKGGARWSEAVEAVREEVRNGVRGTDLDEFVEPHLDDPWVRLLWPSTLGPGLDALDQFDAILVLWRTAAFAQMTMTETGEWPKIDDFPQLGAKFSVERAGAQVSYGNQTLTITQ